jgi:DNA-binding FrmR family transcriptional regulator
MLPEEQTLIVARLRSAEGHLGSVIGMVKNEQNCIKVLHQLYAVQAALHACGHLLLYYQVQQSLETACNNACPEKRSAEIKRLVDLYRFLLMFA